MSGIRITPLGGADEVGASCTLIETDSGRVVVDAGIRIGARSDSQLPDLGRIQDTGGAPDAVVLTHAHMDHSGALPLLHAGFERVPIYATPPTIALVRILLADALKIMGERSGREGEIPLYPREAVDSCLGMMKPVLLDTPVPLGRSGLTLTFFPAGHILGAASAGIEGPGGSILVTGDISVTGQLTVPGMPAPRFRPDVVVVESTYGARLHAHRPTQERELAETVAAAVEAGGKVLVPAFAVGRAQEVLLILQRAMNRKDVPGFPVYVDGMVRAVNTVYRDFPDFLGPVLHRRVLKGADPFYPVDGKVRAVTAPPMRREILEGPPCCIVASSGMLSGGASVIYARELVKNSANLITITGYQDEESPGRALLDLADDNADTADAHDGTGAADDHGDSGERTLPLGGDRVAVNCRVRKYALSAHADCGEITGLMSRLSPRGAVVIVHGDDEARESLARRLSHSLECDILFPRNGEEISLQPVPGRKGYSRRKKYSGGIGRGRTLDAGHLPELHRSLWFEVGRRGVFRIVDLYEKWYGSGAVPAPEVLAGIARLVESAELLFSKDARLPHLFRLVSPDEAEAARELAAERDPARGGRLEMNEALSVVSELLPPETGLYRKGALVDDGVLRLHFHFPAVVEKQFAESLREVEERTGWTVELNDAPHQGMAVALVKTLLPEGWRLSGGAAFLHDRGAVRIKMVPGMEGIDESVVDSLRAEFADRTGLELLVEEAGGTPLPDVETRDSLGRLEINTTYREIENAFDGLPHRPYKKSLKGGSIVLRFISPVVGSRYEDLISHLTKKTGWEMKIHPEPDQARILNLVGTLLPVEWGMVKSPSFHRGGPLVKVKLSLEPAPEEWNDVAARVLEATGVTLERE